jgi:hypothetical protein
MRPTVFRLKRGQATEDVIRGEKPSKKEYDRLYKLLKKQARNPRIPKDIYMALLEALRRPR